MKPNRHVAAAIAVLAIGVGAYLTIHSGAWRGAEATEAAPAVAYTLLNGEKSSIDRLRGKVVLVNFWAPSCTTCVHEMPQVIATHQKYKSRGFETLAVAMSYDPPAAVIDYAESRKLPFGVAIDNTGVIAKSFGDVEMTPTSVLINKRGEIVKRYVGEPDFSALNALVEKLLSEA
jgi:thiol-disulfide isomerase/thioredoxin